MASLALTPLLSLLKEMKMETGGPSVSERDPGLFKELLQLLQQSDPDPEAVTALMERLETEGFSPAKRELPLAKEKESFEPVHIKIGEGVERLPARGDETSSEREPPPIFELERGEKPKTKEGSPLPERHVSGSGERIFHARYASYSSLERKMEDLEAVHTIRSSRSLKEIIRHAEDFGLTITDLKIDRQKEKKSAVPPDAKKMPLPSPAILQRTEHLSQSAAALIQQPERREKGERSTPKLEAVPTLRTLLAEPKAEAKGEKERLQKAENTAPQKQKSDFARLLSGLEVLVKADKPSTKEELSIRPTTETDGVSAPPPADGDPEADFVDPLHTETKMKATEHLTQKIVEARSTLRHFAQSLQEQVENYKPPFTRMQLSLDPKELGNVEVTLVSRGNNLHIQVHSNPTAIGIMATHGQELKSQLVSMGFTDVQMQFNMNQQQQQQQRRGENFTGQYTETEEFSELYESLDLIVPYYV
ncbi:flagellar hook-length control protein FliK [Hydrogenimonas sp.]